MKNLKVSVKLIVSFMLVVALSLIIGLAGFLGINLMSNAADQTYNELSEPLGDLTLTVEYFQRIRVQMQMSITYSGIGERLVDVETDLYDRFAHFEETFARYAESLSTPEENTIYTEIMQQYNTITRPGVLNILEGAKQGLHTLEHMRMAEPVNQSINIISTDLSLLTDARMNAMSDTNAENKATANWLIIMIIGTVVICAVISMTLAIYVERLICKPLESLTGFMNKASSTGDISMDVKLREDIRRFSANRDETGQCIASTAEFVQRMQIVADALESVAGGDLTVEMQLLSDRDVMGVSLKDMVDNLSAMFSDINRSTEQVASGSKQIADGSQALSHGSTEQATAVEQLSSSIADIAEKTKSNASLAAQTAELANTIKLSAEKGTRQMGEMTAAVKEINEASRSINKVMKVIDDIAFQTNILALNAAVEAARAGQHGKGFAVVAEEVRSLASKSAEAARDTGDLISNSMEKAALGERIVGETSASLADIVAGINESGRLVGDIAQSSEEQSEGIDSINHGIDQVAKVIQQNSATAEQSAAASQQMSGQAHMLEELVSRFRLKGRGSRSQDPRLTMPENTGHGPDLNGYGKY
jgi:methyl-accepting chemotaxis protein